MKKIAFGQYYPADSVIHRMDARAKIIATILYIVTVFLCKNALCFAALALSAVLLVALSRIPLRLVLSTLKPLIVIITLILRITVLLAATGVFLTFSTTPIALTDALESLLMPLSKLRLPVHDLAMITTIALRFIPTLSEETEKIMNAQKARGADFSSGGLIKRATLPGLGRRGNPARYRLRCRRVLSEPSRHRVYHEVTP